MGWYFLGFPSHPNGNHWDGTRPLSWDGNGLGLGDIFGPGFGTGWDKKNLGFPRKKVPVKSVVI